MAHECSRDGTCSFGFTSCYHHLKADVRAGQPITDEEAEFVGLGISRRREISGGWRSADEIVPTFELTLPELDADTAELLAALMGHGGQRDRFEFLG